MLFSDQLGLARKLETTAFDLAQRFVGTQELGGAASNPAVLAMLRLDQKWPKGDQVPWCSAFANYIGRCCTALAESEIRLWWWPRYVRA